MDLMFSQDADFSLTQTTAASYEDAVFGDPGKPTSGVWIFTGLRTQQPAELTQPGSIHHPQ